MITVSEICDAIGRQVLAKDLSVGSTAVSNAAVQGRFPAKWFKVVKRHCDRLDLQCPDELFNFLNPTSPEAIPASAPSDPHEKDAA